MFIKTSFLSTAILFITHSSFAQIIDIEEKKPVVENGIEYGYIIKNEQLKTAKGEEYSRYEITLFATNQSGCTRLYADRTTSYSGLPANLLATFTCNNANGKRFTAKSGTIKARDFNVSMKKIINGKEVYEAAKAGYIFRNGETLRDNIIVLVPKGERPIIQCTPNTLPELQ